MHDGKEHSEFKWCNLPEALGKLKWEENKEALRRLNKILMRAELTTQDPTYSL
ncbi:MAG: hypothetical protein JSV57_00400 [Candidatus Bathyarchaeota archaeon]|nr:MAG: hypothetical protein JSV57_00400 [Candidatus Bathyarchaeota archaeon]